MRVSGADPTPSRVATSRRPPTARSTGLPASPSRAEPGCQGDNARFQQTAARTGALLPAAGPQPGRCQGARRDGRFTEPGILLATPTSTRPSSGAEVTAG